MKPKNKFQQHVLELSKRLPKITEPQQRWAYKHCFDHIGKRNAKGTITCLECGHVWKDNNSLLGNALLGCKCPNCATQLDIKTTRQRVFKEVEYFGIITVCDGLQVIRYFHISAYRKAGEQARYSCSEVVQRWLSPNGKETIVARLRGMSIMYYDLWNFGSELEIRPHHRAHDIEPIHFYPRQRVIAEISRNGFTGEYHGIHPLALFRSILTSNKAETLLKAGQYKLLKHFIRTGVHNIDTYWNSIRIAIRNGYTIEDGSVWCDYINQLNFFGKDTNSSKYVCPDNMYEQHDLYMEKRRAYNQRQELEKKRQKARENEEKFKELKAKFFGIAFTDGTIQVRFGKFEKLKEGLEEALSLPHSIEGKELLKPYKIDPKEFAKNQTVSEATRVLLTADENGKMQAVTGVDKDGKLKTVAPTKENADSFLKIDTRGNALENFFKKFSAQFKNPSHTGIYAVSVNAVDKMAAFLDKLVRIDPHDKVLDPYRVTPEGKMQEPVQGKYQPLDLNKLDWKETDKLGLSGTLLQDSLKAMSYGHKSPGLIEVRMEIDGKELQAKARLSFEQQADGTIKIQTHPFQEKPDFEKPFMDVMFTPDEQKQLTTTGHGGRVFELEMTPGGEKIPALVSLDKITNRIEAVPLSEIQIPQILKGVELSDKQQEGLRNGQGVLVENMDKKPRPGEEAGAKITRIVQYNAVNKNFDFLFTPEQRQQHQQERAAKTEQKTGQDDNAPLKARKVGDVWVRPVQGGVELTREQFKDLLNNKPVFVEGMVNQHNKPKQEEGGAKQVEATDQKGQKYNAWVWPDQEAGRIRHTSLPPEQWKEMHAKKQAQPAEGFKTQVAVNNEGKTNEATKQSTEPLKKGQTQPTEKQAEKKEEKRQEQRQSPAKPKKHTGHKM